MAATTFTSVTAMLTGPKQTSCVRDSMNGMRNTMPRKYVSEIIPERDPNNPPSPSTHDFVVGTFEWQFTASHQRLIAPNGRISAFPMEDGTRRLNENLSRPPLLRTAPSASKRKVHEQAILANRYRESNQTDPSIILEYLRTETSSPAQNRISTT